MHCSKLALPIFGHFRSRKLTASRLLKPLRVRWCAIATIGGNATCIRKMDKLNFDNLALRSLPVDESGETRSRQVPGACFSLVKPTPVANPQVVAHSSAAMRLLDLTGPEIDRPEFAEYFSGNKILPGSTTASHCYCGHQFGHFSGQLGDGAAMYLGEVLNSKGERWEIQLKGSGLTPYSRSADGRKVLRSSIREFLCSEAMHHLGVATTRAGSCITSDTRVTRDIFYNGNAKLEKATVVLRIAPTFLRFGSFEIFKPIDSITGRRGPSVGRKDILRQMLDYSVKTFFPQIYETHQDEQQRYLAFYRQVVLSTARLVADWQCIGFCHGVLNTDNMSIMGVTIDYGPYGFMDRFDPDYICNGSDDGGRYTYTKQPSICRWNLEKFAEALSGYTTEEQVLPLELSSPVLEEYDAEYEKCYMEKMRKKFGLMKKKLDTDNELVESFLKTMQDTGADFTNAFRCLSTLGLPNSADYLTKLEETKTKLLEQCSTAEEMKKLYRPRMDPRELMMVVMLMQTNPSLLANLGRGQGMIIQELERMEKAKEMQSLTDEKKKKDDDEKWSNWLQKYSDRLKQEIEDVDNIDEFSHDRVVLMNSNNPKYILRNYIAQNAIEAAENGDYSEVRRVLKLLEDPYGDDVELEDVKVKADAPAEASTSTASSSTAVQGACSILPSLKSYTGVAYDSKPPEWAVDLVVT
ncbi:protein adenylyltransferase SelO, mitochondrial-like [Ptychodera flava]|uniref:protein adenylyltransferase SelO, mitochondrial-like n=1 Tax=Ptychodera flava TaxID=63121 RepID=UPI00396A9C97